MTAPAPEQTPQPRAPTDSVPFGLQVAAAWAWRVGLLVAVALGLLLLVAQAGFVVVAVVVALLLSALLEPLAGRLRRAGLPRLAAAAVVFLGFLAALTGGLWLVGRQLADQFGALGESLKAGLGDLRQFITATFPVSQEQIDRWVDQAAAAAQESSGAALGGLGTAAGTLGEFFAGLALALFITFFALFDGPRMWSWLVGVFPRDHRAAVGPAGARAWTALVAYMRGIIVVALADATLIGLALAILGVPLVVPLVMLTFLGAFVPLVGATLAGGAAVLVALVTEGPVIALILLGVVLAVQWVDSNFLQPLILSRTVNLHPVAVALAISTGTVVAGIGGTVAAVPVVAAVYAAVRPRGHDEEPPQEEDRPPDEEPPHEEDPPQEAEGGA